ncbi:hypothetical protein DHEL01_v203562 [Diaporthe helianthi]|uniref:Uncharacterized protein n=1 Tax=Diaporthe helianthi TaxID=158607 RepID=A0A2P5I6G1_DIAHE|nr:hypothetical protein DHEL01_v203562 [Diaporthe helianthi]
MPATPQASLATGKGFAFVAADSYGQPAAKDRKLIRSHVMKGKNTRRRATAGRLRGRASASVGHIDPPEESHGALAGRRIDRKGAFLPHGAPGPTQLTADAFTFASFPEEIDSESRKMLHTLSSFNDNLRGQDSERTKYHSYKTIKELNKHLADPQLALTDSTTTAVMAMALVAECFGDVVSAHIHVMGLKRIVELRGGIESYASKPLLQAKLYRTGLVYSICTGAEPAFCQETGSYESAFDHLSELFPLRPPDATLFSRSRTFVRSLNGRLYTIFKDVQGLSQLLNNSPGSGNKIPETALEDMLTSQIKECGRDDREMRKLSIVGTAFGGLGYIVVRSSSSNVSNNGVE